MALSVLDLTAYEVGNALLRGVGVGSEKVSAVQSASGFGDDVGVLEQSTEASAAANHAINNHAGLIWAIADLLRGD